MEFVVRLILIYIRYFVLTVNHFIVNKDSGQMSDHCHT